MPRRKRRPKGSGSVYRVAGKGWCAQRDRPSLDGKRRYERKFFERKDQALAQIAAWEAEQVAPAQPARAADTVHAWCEHWVNAKIGVVTEGTLSFYKRHIEYAIPHIGTVRLAELTSQHIRDMLTALMPSGGEPGLSARSRAHVRTVLRAALTMAVDDGVLPRNPCDAVEPPKVKRYDAYALDDAELQALFAAVAGSRLDAMWRLLADFGMRLDELLSAHWADYHQANRTLRIRGTKNDSERYLSLSDEHVRMLQTHWATLQDERTDNPTWKERGYIFPSEVGTKLLQSNVRRVFKQALRAAKLPTRIRIHDLRHTAATNLIAAGNDIATVQYITGHKDSAVLLEIYSHHQEDRNREAIGKVEQRRRKQG